MLNRLFPQIEKFFSLQDFVHQRIAGLKLMLVVMLFLGNIHVVMLMMLLLLVVDQWWWNEGDLA